MRNRTIGKLGKSIIYFPALRELDLVKSVVDAMLMSRLEYRFNLYENGFYKFLSPCNVKGYQIGDSWTEELGISEKEFRTAFSHLGVVHKSKKQFDFCQDKFQSKYYCSYYDRIERKTYYFRNHNLVDKELNGFQVSPSQDISETCTTDFEEVLELPKEQVVNFQSSSSISLYTNKTTIHTANSDRQEKNTKIEKDDRLSSSFTNVHLSDSLQSDVESTEKTDVNNAPCETKKNVCLNENLKIEKKELDSQSESITNTRIDQKENLANNHPIENKNFNTNITPCSITKIKNTTRRTGDIDEYSQMQRSKNRVGVNKIDLTTRQHFIADIRALNASELPNYQKAELALLNERFCGAMEKQYPNVFNMGAFIASQWEQAIAVYLTILEREEGKARRERELVESRERDRLLRKEIEKMPIAEMLRDRLQSLETTIVNCQKQVANYKQKGHEKMLVLFRSRLEQAIADKQDLEMELQGAC